MNQQRPRHALSAVAALTVAWIAIGSLVARGVDPAPVGGDDWKYDVLYRKVGKPYRGLITEDTADHVRIRCVIRRPGAPTVVYTEEFRRDEIDHLEKLDDEERRQLTARLDGLARERNELASYLKAIEGKATGGDESPELKTVPWPPDRRVRARCYASTHFRLVSDARDEVIQLAALNLEQVFAAYARTLPPRLSVSRPTTILLMSSSADYQTYARGRGLNLLNPAFYDAAADQIVCLGDLDRLADEVKRVQRNHDAQREKLKQTEDSLKKAYAGKPPAELLKPLEESRRKMKAAEDHNAEDFAKARRRLFQRLYHEAFHAYVNQCVYPAADGELPRWLDEGLAQIFETAVVEVGELRIVHVDKERWDALRAAQTKGTMLSTAELLRAGPRQFVFAHAAEQQASDRHYLASWAVAFDLTFERRLLGTKALDQYVAALKRQTDPLVAFRDLVGQPLTEFEKDHTAYLKRLRPDGTAPK